MITKVVNLSIHQIGVTAFSDYGKDICSITSDVSDLLRSVSMMKAYGGTNITDGLSTSYKKLLKSEMNDRIIILMTDGRPNSGDRSAEIATMIRREYNIRLAVIFIGPPSDRGYQIAESVASSNIITGERPLFYTSQSMSELGNIFQRVYTDITARK